MAPNIPKYISRDARLAIEKARLLKKSSGSIGRGRATLPEREADEQHDADGEAGRRWSGWSSPARCP